MKKIYPLRTFLFALMDSRLIDDFPSDSLLFIIFWFYFILSNGKVCFVPSLKPIGIYLIHNNIYQTFGLYPNRR